MRVYQAHTLISFLHILSFPVGKNSKIVHVGEDAKGATQRSPTYEAEPTGGDQTCCGPRCPVPPLQPFFLQSVCEGREGAGGFQEQRPLVAIAFPSAACRVGEPPLGL